jgi:hypothetical protein
VRDYLRRWITTVAEVLRADAIFWDEPHFYLPFGTSREQGLWGCCCQRCQERFRAIYHRPFPAEETPEVRQGKQVAIAELLAEVTAWAAGHGLRNVVCMLPEYEQLDGLQAKFDRFAVNPHLDVLATDPYPLIHGQEVAVTGRFCDALRHTCAQYGKASQIWIQGFRVPAGQEHLLGDEMRLVARHGIHDLAIWSYLATAYMASHTCADAGRVWEILTRTMQELRQQQQPAADEAR